MKKTVTIAVLAALILIMESGERGYAEPSPNRRAMVLSLLVPGLGQYSAGATGYGKLFFAAELASWGAYYYNSGMKTAKRRDYLGCAARHAGVNPEGKGLSYLNAIGAYASSYEYNNYQLTQDDPVVYSGSLEWEWDSTASRFRFKELRKEELDYENNMKFCVAGIVLNHLLSALHAAKQTGDAGSPAVTVRALDSGLAATYSRSY